MSKLKIAIVSVIAALVIVGVWIGLYFFVFADKGIDETEVAQAYKNEKANHQGEKKPTVPDDYAINVITEILTDEKTKDEKIPVLYNDLTYFTTTFEKYLNHKDIDPKDYAVMVLFSRDVQAAKNGSSTLNRQKVDNFKAFLQKVLKVDDNDEDYFNIKETLQQETGFAVDVHSKLGWKIKDFQVNKNYPNNEANPNVGICLINNSKEDMRVTFSKSRTENKQQKVMETGKGRYGIYDDYVNCLKQIEILNQAKKEGNTGTKKDGSVQKATGWVQNDIVMETVTIKPGQYILVDGVYASVPKK